MNLNTSSGAGPGAWSILGQLPSPVTNAVYCAKGRAYWGLGGWVCNCKGGCTLRFKFFSSHLFNMTNYKCLMANEFSGLNAAICKIASALF